MKTERTYNLDIYQIKGRLAALSDIVTTDPPGLDEDIYIRDGFANIWACWLLPVVRSNQQPEPLASSIS